MGLAEQRRARAGWAGGGVSSCGVPPLWCPRTPGTHTISSSHVFPKKQLKIYPVWTDDLTGSWLLASWRVGVRGHGQERGPSKLSPARAGAEVAAAQGSAGSGR